MSCFKIGSMVIGHAIYSPEKTLIGEIVDIDKERPVIHVEEGDSYYIENFVIKCVRKPRKGGKEARDIVAKIGWMYLMAKKDADDMDWCVDDIVDCQSISTQSICLKVAYEKAKSMLKEDL